MVYREGAETVLMLSGAPSAVVIVVPYALTYSGVHGSDAYRPVAVPLDWPKLAVLFGIAAACGRSVGTRAAWST